MLTNVIEDLRHGKPILVFDDEKREGETDLMVASQYITPEYIRQMRQDGGGLICVTIREKEAEKISLPYMDDFLSRYGGISGLFRNTDLGYDVSSAFSFSVNLRSNYTGISDIERAATISGISSYLSELGNLNGSAQRVFAERFRSPGHVFLLIARAGYFAQRRGHTELGTYLVERAGLIPSIAMVEMLSNSGRSMTKDEAKQYASSHSITFIEGRTIIDEWSHDKGNGYGGL